MPVKVLLMKLYKSAGHYSLNYSIEIYTWNLSTVFMYLLSICQFRRVFCRAGHVVSYYSLWQSGRNLGAAMTAFQTAKNIFTKRDNSKLLDSMPARRATSAACQNESKEIWKLLQCFWKIAVCGDQRVNFANFTLCSFDGV